MAFLTLPTVTVTPAPCIWNTAVRGQRLAFSSGYSLRSRSIAKIGGGLEVRAFFPNPSQEPIFKEALKVELAHGGRGLLSYDRYSIYSVGSSRGGASRRSEGRSAGTIAHHSTV